MSRHSHDEETPLLRSKQKQAEKTPLPWGQFSILLFMQLAEPMTSQVINPFAPDLIRRIGITHGDETKVGHYVGMMQSLFFLTQACTVMHWSRLSDTLGRKPVILIGLFGLSISMYCFGVASTFWGLVISRCLNGALNGNIGVMKSVIAEITDSTNVAQAIGYLPLAWGTGSTLGPMVGGFLQQPAEQFPSIFGNNAFLKKHPYFLPCAVPASFSALAFLITLGFFKETVKNPVPFARLLKLRDTKGNIALQSAAAPQDPSALSDPVSDYESASRRSSKLIETADSSKPLPMRKILTPRVLVAGGNYAMLSLADIAFRSIQPVFLSTPIALGGLGWSPSQIGKLLSTNAVLNAMFQVFFFAKLHDRLGSKTVFMIGVIAFFPIYALFPFVNEMARLKGVGAKVYSLLGLQILLALLTSLSYSSVFIYINASAPNRRSFGATNGICQLTVSIMRAIGPAMANSLFSLTIRRGYLGGYLVYVVLVGVGALATYVGYLLPSAVWIVPEE